MFVSSAAAGIVLFSVLFFPPLIVLLYVGRMFVSSAAAGIVLFSVLFSPPLTVLLDGAASPPKQN